MGGISIDYNSLAVNVNKKRFPSKLSRMVDVCNFNMRTLMNNWQEVIPRVNRIEGMIWQMVKNIKGGSMKNQSYYCMSYYHLEH